MGSKRLSTGALVVALVTAVIGGAMVAPSAVEAAPLAAPTNLAPDDPAAHPTSPTPSSNLLKNVVLTWNAVAGASAYDVEISDSTGSFETPAVSTTTFFPSFAAPAGLARGDYAWRVRVSGEVWSDVAWFARGYSSTPGDPHAVSDRGAAVTWDAVPDASYYEVQFSQLPFVKDAFDTGLGENAEPGTTPIACMVTATMFAPGIKVSGPDKLTLKDDSSSCSEFYALNAITSVSMQWYWRVRARDGVLQDDSFVDNDKPASACNGVWYLKTEHDVADTPECGAWAYPTDSDAVTTFERVSATKVTGTPTALTISPRSTAATSPAVITNSPVFSWTNPDDNDAFYRIYLSRTADMSTQDYVWETTSDHFAPIAQLPDRTTRWWWTVQSCAVTVPDAGKILSAPNAYCGEPAPAQSFVKVAKSNATADSNVIAYGPPVVASGGTTLSWHTLIDATKPFGGLQIASPEAIGYRVQISDAYGSFTSPRLDVTVDRHGNVPNESSITLRTSTLGSGYRWRVRGVDETLNEYPWSNEMTVGTLQSASAKIVTATGLALGDPVDVQFNAPVDGVSASTLHIVATSNGAAVPGSVTLVGTDRYRFSHSTPFVAGESYRIALSTAVTTSQTSVPAVASTTSIRAATTVDSSSSALTKHTGDYGWGTYGASDAIGKTYVRSSDKTSTSTRSYVQTKVRGGTLSVYACMGRTSGNAGIYVDGVLKKTVSLYKKSSSCGKLTTVSLSSGSAHTVRFAAMGTKVAQSTSAMVRFDAFKVS